MTYDSLCNYKYNLTGAVRVQSTEYDETSMTLISGLTVLYPTEDTTYKCVVMYQNETVAERMVPLYVYGLFIPAKL